MAVLSSRSSKFALLASVAALCASTPILASNGIGLRGGQIVPQHYGMQYAANAYMAPQAQPYMQSYQPQPRPQPQYLGQVVSESYQIQAPQQPYTQNQNMSSSYVRASASPYGYAGPQAQIPQYVPSQHIQAIPVGNYQYASYNAGPSGLRGASQAFRNGFDVGGVTVRTSVRHSERMLNWQDNTTGKVLTLLTNRANGTLAPNSLYIGAGFKGGLMWQKTSVAGQFPLLSRFPDFSNRTDDQTGVFAINNAALAFTGTFGDWTTLYMQTEYSETEFVGQSEMQLRKAFVVFGNLEKTPFYAAFGRKTIDFGNFDGYNAFTQTEAQHYFHAVSDQPVFEVGYYNHGFKLSASAFSAGRHLRVAYAGEENNIGNYSASIAKEFNFGNGRAFTLGTSYLHDTSYRNNYTAHTFSLIQSGTPPANFIEYRNSAVDAFVEYNSPLFDLMFEYTTTLEPWAAAIPQDANGVVDPAYIDANGEITFDQNLEVFVAQARFKPMINGRRVSFAAVGNWGNIGDDFVGVGIGGQPTSWKKNQQHALSVEYPVSPYFDIGIEYMYNKGFIPFVAPQLVSSNDTVAHAINIGIKARF
ncbi:MAG: hypothetical protein COA69_12695 [Robiginitomaculum sp.]|nr:MAG: hypothetical protein COA69_12695 [Robiginitomaculum sp.]